MSEKHQDRVEIAGLRVARPLADLVERACDGLDITPDTVWSGFAGIVRDMGPRNAELIAIREEMQAEVDAWYRDNANEPTDVSAQKAFLGGDRLPGAAGAGLLDRGRPMSTRRSPPSPGRSSSCR